MSDPPKDEREDKSIVTEEDPIKLLMPMIEQSGSDLNMLNLQPLSSSGMKMTLEEAQAQLTKIQRLANLKAEKKKTEEKLKKLSQADVQAQALELARFEIKRKKMLDEYKHYVNYRTGILPITKINYKIHELGLSEWIEIHALASKMKGLPPPSELSAFGLTPTKKKRKRTGEIIKEVFVKENITMDGMHMNLVHPRGVVGSRGLVITEPEYGIFFYNGNFDLTFQRESEFHLATTPQLIRTQQTIQRNTSKAEEMYKKLEFTIEARDDADEAKKIVKENLDGGGMQ
uniref:Uncharacterized protein n=1 Tax=Tanacetum cinerariifolium TaxID=118510 RepID=A0A6L2LR70_TANCI|nr:hypothetical protein [Tanacetum cinerariifolium]